MRRKTASVTRESWDLMVGTLDPELSALGFSPAQSCAAVSNITQENSLLPSLFFSKNEK